MVQVMNKKDRKKNELELSLVQTESSEEGEMACMKDFLSSEVIIIARNGVATKHKCDTLNRIGIGSTITKVYATTQWLEHLCYKHNGAIHL